MLTKKQKRKAIIGWSIIIIGLVIILTSCSCGDCDKAQETSRIHLKETRVVNGYRYQIIEVDGREFFSNVNGGMVELSKE
jgi:hypothetical protein